MTNNIEKIYELAGIPVSEWYLCHPPFTAEKQLELIKWLATKFILGKIRKVLR